MLTSGFVDAPVSKWLVIGVVASFIFSAAADLQPYLHFHTSSQLLQSQQYWRILTWQLSYDNPTEVFFAAASLYNLRLIERLWGSRKFGSFLLTTLPYTTLLPPLLLAVLSPRRPLPPLAGPTPLVFAILAQFHAAVPYTFRYRLSSTARSEDGEGVQLTSKAAGYLLPLQLAFCRVPVSLAPAAVGWMVGLAWRAEVLPFTGGTGVL